MRIMPNPPRTEGLDHEKAVDALQKWLWACLAAGWEPTNPSGGERWSHDDNMTAMSRGWMISQPPGSPFLDLFSLYKNGKSPYELMQDIARMAFIDPLCAKAVIALTGQKLLYPDVKFAFNTPPKIVRSADDRSL